MEITSIPSSSGWHGKGAGIEGGNEKDDNEFTEDTEYFDPSEEEDDDEDAKEEEKQAEDGSVKQK